MPRQTPVHRLAQWVWEAPVPAREHRIVVSEAGPAAWDPERGPATAAAARAEGTGSCLPRPQQAVLALRPQPFHSLRTWRMCVCRPSRHCASLAPRAPLQAAPVASSRGPQHGRGGSDSDSEPEGFFERRVLKPLPASLQVQRGGLSLLSQYRQLVAFPWAAVTLPVRCSAPPSTGTMRRTSCATWALP